MSSSVFAADGLVQLHWQDPKDTSKTLFFAQTIIQDAEGLSDWIKTKTAEHADSCPEGWCWMVCDSTNKFFALKARGT